AFNTRMSSESLSEIQNENRRTYSTLDPMLLQHSARKGATPVPLLRWAGSKRRLIPILRTYWRPDYERYLEPFAGSACLFFCLNPKRAILGDLNHELISTYLEIKYRPDALHERLSKLRPGRSEYKRLRSLDPGRLSGAARAARFVYLNRYCFNGL